MKQDHRRKITPEQHQEIVRRLRAGESVRVLAGEYGLSRKTVDEMKRVSASSKSRFSRRQLAKYLKQLGVQPQLVREAKPAPEGKTTRQARSRPRRRPLHGQGDIIIQRHNAGESTRTLAAEFGVSRTAIYQVLKRAKDSFANPPLVPMTDTHLAWLREKLLVNGHPGRKRWQPEAVRAMLFEQFNERVSLRTHWSQLCWMGVGLRGRKTTAERRKKLRELKRQAMEQNQRVVRQALAEGVISPMVRGRPGKTG